MTSPILQRPGRVAVMAAFGFLVCLLGSGCATITRGTKEVLVVESEPGGAAVQLSNGMTGLTPTSFKIPRKGAVTVTVFKDGYETAVVEVHTQVAGAGAAGMAGNVLIGGLIGAGIDAASGGMLEHKPNPVRVTLVPVRTKPPPAPTPDEEFQAPPKGEVVADVDTVNEGKLEPSATNSL